MLGCVRPLLGFPLVRPWSVFGYCVVCSWLMLSSISTKYVQHSILVATLPEILYTAVPFYALLYSTRRRLCPLGPCLGGHFNLSGAIEFFLAVMLMLALTYSPIMIRWPITCFECIIRTSNSDITSVRFYQRLGIWLLCDFDNDCSRNIHLKLRLEDERLKILTVKTKERWDTGFYDW